MSQHDDLAAKKKSFFSTVTILKMPPSEENERKLNVQNWNSAATVSHTVNGSDGDGYTTVRSPLQQQ